MHSVGVCWLAYNTCDSSTSIWRILYKTLKLVSINITLLTDRSLLFDLVLWNLQSPANWLSSHAVHPKHQDHSACDIDGVHFRIQHDSLALHVGGWTTAGSGTATSIQVYSQLPQLLCSWCLLGDVLIGFVARGPKYNGYSFGPSQHCHNIPNGRVYISLGFLHHSDNRTAGLDNSGRPFPFQLWTAHE